MNQASVVEEYRKLLELDQKTCDKGRNLVLTFLECLQKAGTLSQVCKENDILSGSLIEGSFLARLFYKNSFFSDEINRETEVDLEQVVGDIPKEFMHYIEEIDDKPGYCCMKFFDEKEKKLDAKGFHIFLDGFNHKMEDLLDEDGYLAPHRFKEITLGHMQWEMQKEFELFVAMALDKQSEDVKIEYDDDITKATVTSERMVHIDGKPYLKIAYDAAPLVRIKWWPSVASEWKTRPRNWPRNEIIDEVTQEGYIIFKPSFTEGEVVENRVCRYAFSHVERRLVKERTEQQHLIYFMLKVIVYKFIKPIDPDKISSFLAKNTMLWATEEFCPKHEMWESVITSLEYLLTKLLEAFREGSMQYFFVPKINVIQHIPTEVRTKVFIELTKIHEDVFQYLLPPTANEVTAANQISQFVSKLSDKLVENQALATMSIYMWFINS